MKQSHKSTPTISVVMPVYNCAAFVAEAIESILVQSFADFEFIIVDDGSTDGTPDTIRDYARQDKRIRPFFLEHSYAARATNIGVRHARGQWFARMDADDLSLPHRLETELAWIKSTGVDLCGSQAGLFGKREGVLWFPEDHDAMQRELLFRICLPHPAVIMALSILKEYPYNEFTYTDDYEMWTRLAPRFRMGNVPEVLVHCRVHQNQTVNVHMKQIRSDFKKYRFSYFYTLYPHTPLPDYLALARVSDRQPMSSIAELRRAGQWLVELARHPDPLLREKMVRRWQKTCKCSMALGDECEAVFQKYRGQFDVADENGGYDDL